MQSGSAFSNFKRRDYQHLNFTFVAQRLGCDFPADADAELDCMRQVPAQMIINFIGRYAESGTQPPLEFRPVPDGRVVFDNYAARASQGLISRRPAVVGLTANEEATMIVWPWPTGANATDKILQGPSRADLDRGTVDRFVCVASNTTAVRSAAGNLTTYRYQYAGNFSGLSPLPWMGSYHTSDVPMFFGTYERPGPVDAFQRGVAEAMQDALVAFVEDPEGSQLRDLGWLPVLAQPPDGVQLRFGAGARIAQNITVSEVDGSCLLGLPYDSSP